MRSKLVASAFLTIVFGVPAAETWWHMRDGEGWQGSEILGAFEKARIERFELDLREASFLHEVVSPYFQWGLTTLLRKGNEKAVFGRGDWLYYADDLDVITQPGFMAGRPQLIDAVVDFRQQLQAVGAELVFVPVPAKPMVEPSQLSTWTADVDFVANVDADAYIDALERAGVPVVDLGPVFDSLRVSDPTQPLFLARDTHWTHRTLTVSAQAIAAKVRDVLGAELAELPKREWQAFARTGEWRGDTVDMLRFPTGVAQQLFAPLAYSAAELEGFAFDEASPVLLLGDSFSGVYSDQRFGLGSDGGLPEQIALQLQTTIDAIVIAGGSAKSVREALARRSGGPSGKRVVIWQTSMRDLVGDLAKWERVELRSGDAPTAAPERARVIAEVREVSRIPAEFGYDFCLVVHEYRVQEVLEGPAGLADIWVAHVGMRDFKDAEGASIEVGQRFELELELIEAHYDLENTSWVDDTEAGLTIWYPTAARPVDEGR